MPRFILYNIEYCEGTTKGLYQYLNLFRAVRSKKELDSQMVDFLKTLSPDILALVEVDSGSLRSRHQDQSARFMNKLNLKNLAYSVKYPLVGFFRIFRKMPIFKFQGNALLSKYSFGEIKYHYLSKGTKRVVIQATANLPDPITFLIVHLALRKKTRLKQLKEVAELVNNVKNPVFLAGDFNTFSTEELDFLMKETELVDAYHFNNKKIKFTEPSWKPKYRLDNILVSPQIRITNYEIIDVRFSDHLPVLVDFELI